MSNNETKIIAVNPEESALLLEAKRIEAEAIARKKKSEQEASEKYGKPLIDPMLDFQTEENARIMQAYEDLKADYAKSHNTTVPPILIPAAPTGSRNAPTATPEVSPRIYRPQPYKKYSEMAPLPEDLKNTFLSVVPTFRNRERLFVWVGNHYRYLPDSEMKARIKTVLRDEFYIPNPTALLNTILSLLKAEESISGIPDNFPTLIAVENGVLDWQTMQFSPSSPSHHLTHYLDVPWMGYQPCPVFNRVIEYAAGGDPELILRLWETIGFLLVSDTRAKRFVVFQGEGDCGKSLLCNLLTSFFERGDFASLADYQFGERFSLSFIANSHFCSCMDLPDGTIDGKAVSTLKQIIGGDPVSVEAKGKDAYTDYLHCKVLFGTNHPIKLKSRDAAFARRLLLIPFRYPVADKDKDRDLLNKLKLERSGILYQALHAYRGVVQRDYTFTGEARFGFTTEHIVVEAPAPDSTAIFSSECCVLDPQAFTSSEALHTAFLKFCCLHSLPSIADRAAFSRALNNHHKGLLRADKKRLAGIPTNGYWGIRLKEEEPSNV